MGKGKELGLWQAALLVASVGIEMAVAIGLGYLIGSFLDRELGSEPWLMYLFVGCGAIAGFRSLWRTASKYWPKD